MDAAGGGNADYARVGKERNLKNSPMAEPRCDIIEILMNTLISHLEIIMPSVTVRNIPEETHRALRVRAATHGRSTEAEIRDILENAVRNENRVKLGSLLSEIGREVGGVDIEIERDRTPAKPMSFE
jgi:plasmid stability protein